MNYQFPKIETIDDVLPAVAGRDEFVVAEREFGTVVNYLVNMPDTFAMKDKNDLLGAIRRECRGIIFNKQGFLISRPYHKFFNINEREETQDHIIDLNKSHMIMEKLDGSFVRPIMMNDKVYLGTKMGITDIANDALAWVETQEDADEKLAWLEKLYLNKFTPIFEWMSDANRIVVKYEKPAVVLTAIRTNKTGLYLSIYDKKFPFDVVKQYGRIDGSVEEYVARARLEKDREGDIIRFSDGHMLKCKNDWYVQIHKTKEIVQTDYKIVDIILDEKLDDTKSKLEGDDFDRVEKIEKEFWDDFHNVLGRLEGLVMIAKTVYGGDKKRVALEFVPNLLNKTDSQFIFRALGGYDLRELLIEYCKKNVGGSTNYKELKEWMKA